MRAIAWDWTKVVSGGGVADRTVRVWDMHTGACVQVCSGHSGGVTGTQVFPTHVASTSTDGSLRLWYYSSSYASAPLGESFV